MPNWGGGKGRWNVKEPTKHNTKLTQKKGGLARDELGGEHHGGSIVVGSGRLPRHGKKITTNAWNEERVQEKKRATSCKENDSEKGEQRDRLKWTKKTRKIRNFWTRGWQPRGTAKGGDPGERRAPGHSDDCCKGVPLVRKP